MGRSVRSALRHAFIARTSVSGVCRGRAGNAEFRTKPSTVRPLTVASELGRPRPLRGVALLCDELGLHARRRWCGDRGRSGDDQGSGATCDPHLLTAPGPPRRSGPPPPEALRPPEAFRLMETM